MLAGPQNRPLPDGELARDMMFFMIGKFRLPFAILLLACSAAAQTTPAERLARWKPVDMPLTPALSAQQRQMVNKLVHACRLLDEIFWRQSDADGLSLYRSTGDEIGRAHV